MKRNSKRSLSLTSKKNSDQLLIVLADASHGQTLRFSMSLRIKRHYLKHWLKINKASLFALLVSGRVLPLLQLPLEL